MVSSPSPFFAISSTDPARVDAKYRLADALRGLVEDVALLDPAGTAIDVIEQAISLVGNARDTLASGTRLSLDPTISGADTMPAERGPVVGRANALAAPLHLDVTDDGACGHSNYGPVYDGIGAVHGGILAAAFMDVQACAHFATADPARWGHIGTFTVRYRTATPIGERVDYEARLEKFDGRKSFYSAVARVGDQVVAESDAVFIEPRDA